MKNAKSFEICGGPAERPGPAPGAAASYGFAVAGSGGAGALTAGNVLLEAAGRAGWYGHLSRAVGPQIRGGEAVALLRLSRRPVGCGSDRLDALFALDWDNVDRFAAEMPLGADSLIFADPARGDIPGRIAESGAAARPVSFGDLAGAVRGGRSNMVAAGMIAAMAGIPDDALHAVLAESLGRKGADTLRGALECIEAGRRAAREMHLAIPAARETHPAARWVITGNEAAALGALRAGVRFVAAYPITPATEIMEWLAARLPAVGGNLVQAEDELASMNMIIGASFGGVPSLTATSGPGLALMSESIGLAVSAEVPVVIIDVMRGGPSTGIPTKSEQSDLNMALHGMHGDAPHLVVAPNGIGDCLFTVQWAVHLAEAMQAPAIVLSDQTIGQARAVIDRPADVSFIAGREIARQPGAEFRRYAVTDSGISPMSLPGTPGGAYVADGLEHAPTGRPSSAAEDHAAQMDKRHRKLVNFNYGDHWADVEGGGATAILTWGSLTAPAREALDRLAAEGIDDTRLISLRLLAPALPEAFDRAMAGVRRVLVVEQTHSGQFYRYLRASYRLPDDTRLLHRAGPLPIRPAEIQELIREWHGQ